MKAAMVKATRPGNSMTPENILVAQSRQLVLQKRLRILELYHCFSQISYCVVLIHWCRTVHIARISSFQF